MSINLSFSSQVYSLETIKKAAYRLSGLISVEMKVQGDDIACDVHFPLDTLEPEQERLIAAFRNEVLDQDLRATIASETATIRNAVLGLAFSKSGLQGGE